MCRCQKVKTDSSSPRLAVLWHITSHHKKVAFISKAVWFHSLSSPTIVTIRFWITHKLHSHRNRALLNELLPLVPCAPRSQPLPPPSMWAWEDFIQGIKAQPAYGHLAHIARYLGAKIAFACKPKCRLSSYGTSNCVKSLKPIHSVSRICLHRSRCRLD